MKLLIIHNFYPSDSGSGEDLTLSAIGDYLRESGIEIDSYTMKSWRDLNWKCKFHALITFSNLNIINDIKFWIKIRNVDAIQIHNPFPSLNLVKILLLRCTKIPIVKVVQNYRLSCLNGKHFRQLRTCQSCSYRSFFIPGIKYKCYQQSGIKSFVIAVHQVYLNRVLNVKKCRYVAISKGVEQHLISQKVNRANITRIYNSTNSLKKVDCDADEFLFVGRLEFEKGISNLLEVWKSNPQLPILNVVGDGSLSNVLRSKYDNLLNVRFWGSLPHQEMDFIALRSVALIAPDLWEEPFGRVKSEALSRGQTLITTSFPMGVDIRSNASVLFISRDSINDWIRVIEMANSKRRLNSFDENYKLWKDNFSPDVIKPQWKEFFNSLVRFK